MLVCNAVAMITQARYGTSAMAARRACGQMAIIDHTIVASTMMTSTSASTRFLRPNWIGVKAAFAATLMSTGHRTERGISPRTAWTITKPYATRMIGYRMLHTVPNVAAGGAHDGLSSVSYQLMVEVYPLSADSSGAHQISARIRLNAYAVA